MGKQIIQKDKTIIATFENTEVYERYKHEIPSETLCLIKEKPITIDNSEQIFNGDSFNGGRGAWTETIELSKPFTDFDYLFLCFSDGDSGEIGYARLDSHVLYQALTKSILDNKKCIVYPCYYMKIISNKSTTTRWVHSWTKMYVKGIWGWKA